MTAVEIAPSPTRGLVDALHEEVDGEIRFDTGTRAAYATDGSAFRQVPIGVVVPRTVEDGAAAVAVCHAHDVPVLSRGGGTSLAGQCTNTAVVIDWSKYCNRLLSVDAENKTCVVEPGIVLDDLNRQLAGYGLRYGPEPSTHPNCTLGGMIGNNSCGATAQRAGKVVDNLRSLDVLLYDGTRFTCGRTTEADFAEIDRRGDRQALIYRTLRELRDVYSEEIRRRYPDIPRRVSGYNLDSLLPEHGFDVAGLLVGSEGTLATVLRAELELIPVLPERSLVVLGYDDIATAADAVPDILAHEPTRLEGVDRYLVHDEHINDLGADGLAQLPQGAGFLMVEFGADEADRARELGEGMLESLSRSAHDAKVSFFTDSAQEAKLWAVREAGLGATAHLPGGVDTHPGWEDSAVHPDRLGDYLRDLHDLFEEFGYASSNGPSLYGHFGQGCVHTRIPFDMTSAAGVADYRRFLERAADLVVSYGGSLSGEHGDGQARGELLPRMFGPEIMAAFEQLKGLFDPRNRMNPGKVVHPRALDADLRQGTHWAPEAPRDLFFSYPEDGGSFIDAANRCVGVGLCRQHTTEGTVMCPSYQVTREEEHSTRGRARLLFEMLNGHGDGPVTDGWRSTEVRDALDLCLACKGCKSDCPVDVDMATYKAEFLAHHYAGRIRPRADLALGWLPVLGGAVSRLRLAPLVNALGSLRPLRVLAMRAANLEQREIPLFAGETLQQWWRRRGPRGTGERGDVLLWPDTFTNTFHPHIGMAAIEVMEAAGWRVQVPTEPVCCALTWISTGQLTTARRVLRRTVEHLAPHVRAGGYVVGLEPSCTAVFRSDAPDLLAGEPDVARLRDQTVTFAELLTQHTPDWSPPQVKADVTGIAQVHCHQHAIMGWDADTHLLQAAGVDVERLDSGCCGLAGNFGFQAGHGEVSEALAEQVLLPRVREADAETLVLADGFSCRTQIHELAGNGREAAHVAEVLRAALHGELDGRTHPERDLAPRPQAPGAGQKAAALAAVGAILGAAGYGLRALLSARLG